MPRHAVRFRHPLSKHAQLVHARRWGRAAAHSHALRHFDAVVRLHVLAEEQEQQGVAAGAGALAADAVRSAGRGHGMSPVLVLGCRVRLGVGPPATAELLRDLVALSLFLPRLGVCSALWARSGISRRGPDLLVGRVVAWIGAPVPISRMENQ